MPETSTPRTQIRLRAYTFTPELLTYETPLSPAPSETIYWGMPSKTGSGKLTGPVTIPYSMIVDSRMDITDVESQYIVSLSFL